MKLKPISKAILAAAAAASIMPFAAQAADVNVYGLVATGLYYQKTEGADNGNVGMAQYRPLQSDLRNGRSAAPLLIVFCGREPRRFCGVWLFRLRNLGREGCA